MNVKFENDNATRGTVFLLLSDLKVDERAQRRFDPGWAGTLAEKFDPAFLGVLHVSRRKDGSYWVIDGQHRAAAAKKFLGANLNGQRIECKVYENLTIAQEARLFKELNAVRLVKRIDKFLKGVTAGEQAEAAINRVVEGVGLKIGYTQADRTITAVGALQLVYHGFNHKSRRAAIRGSDEKHPELLKMVLSVINSAWGGTGDSLNGHIIEGLGRLLLVRQRVLDIPELIKRLAQYPGGPAGLIGKARGRRDIMGGQIGVNVAEVILEAYNRGRRSGALEPLR